MEDLSGAMPSQPPAREALTTTRSQPLAEEPLAPPPAQPAGQLVIEGTPITSANTGAGNGDACALPPLSEDSTAGISGVPTTSAELLPGTDSGAAVNTLPPTAGATGMNAPTEACQNSTSVVTVANLDSDRAAVRIQAQFRGLLARRRYAQLRAHPSEKAEPSAEGSPVK